MSLSPYVQKFAERSRPSHRLVLFTQPDFGRRQRTVPHSLGYFVGRIRIVADLRLIIQRHRSLIGMTGIPLLYPRHHSIAAFSAAFTAFRYGYFLPYTHNGLWNLRFSYSTLLLKMLKVLHFLTSYCRHLCGVGNPPKNLQSPPNSCQKLTSFCEVFKKMHTKEYWFLFFCLTVYMSAFNFAVKTFLHSGVSAFKTQEIT